MSAESDADALPLGALGPYRLVREVGRWAAAVVYEAVDTRIGRTVALKVLRPAQGLTPGDPAREIERFRREARAVARLDHPHIVTVHDIGEQEGTHFLVLEFLHGQTLRERLSDGAPLPPEDAVSITEKIAAALDTLHAAGMVHRDIKPSNVMLLPDGRVKLLDFGVARQFEDATVTHAGTLIGSPAYMSPEQARGEAATEASDIWALGVLTYEMLTGHPPFQASHIPSVLYQIAHEAPPPLPPAASRLQPVLDRALSKAPGTRYPAAGALAQALRAALQEKTPAAAPVAPAPGPARVTRPAPSPGLKLLPLVFLLLIGGGVGAWLYGGASSRPSNATSKPLPTAGTQPRPLPTAISLSVTTPAITPSPAPPVSSAPLSTPSPLLTVVERTTPSPGPTGLPTVKPSHRVAVAKAPAAVTHATVVRASPAARVERDRGEKPEKTTKNNGLVGTWHGNIGKRHATLIVDELSGDRFTGKLTVETEKGNARFAITGNLSSDTGRLAFWAAQTLPDSPVQDMDLGQESGKLLGPDYMGGLGLDSQKKLYTWSLSR